MTETFEFDVIIPARMAATRLPGKPLLDVAGKPLVVRVADAARDSNAARIVVATDTTEIADVVTQAGYEAVMTPVDCPSGTDRLASAIESLGLADDRLVVNVQGDEPDMPGALVDQVASLLATRPDAVMATACAPVESDTQWLDPSVVKVVRDQSGRALYFSRAPIPGGAGERPDGAARHVGIYAYRAAYVAQYAAREPAPLELTERLEQLRVLWHGETIVCCDAVAVPGPGVDTPDDLERVRQVFARQ